MQQGEPLLERNKELEAQIKEYKFQKDEQEHEIMHLKQRCVELEKQLRDIMQENQADTSANQNMMTMHEELTPLEEVRQDLMCSRCLRDINESIKNLVEQSSLEPTEKISDDYERSMLSESTYEFSHSDIEDSIRKPGDDLQFNTIDSSDSNSDLVAIYKLSWRCTSSMESVAEETPTASAKDNLDSPVAIAPWKEESSIMSSQSIDISEYVYNAPIESSSDHSIERNTKCTQTANSFLANLTSTATSLP